MTIPEEVLKDYAKRTDIEGLKFSPNIWAKRQMRNIEKQVMSAIMRGQSAETLSKDLVQYLKGGSVGMGHSIRYKTLRLARTEGDQYRFPRNKASGGDLEPCGGGYALEVEQPTPNMGCLQSVGPTGFVPYGGRGLSNRSTTTKTSSQLHLLYDGSVEETEGMANKKTCVYH